MIGHWAGWLVISAVMLVVADRLNARNARREHRQWDRAERLTTRALFAVIIAGTLVSGDVIFVRPWWQELAFYAGWLALVVAIRLAHETYKRRHLAE